MENKINFPALFFYGLLSGALAVVLMVSFQHFENFYQPEILARSKYVQTAAKQKNIDYLKPQSVTFSYVSPTAKTVAVVGDFNAWGAYPLNLNRNENKNFTLTLALPTGKYKYYFLVDGEVVLDTNAPQVVADGENFNILEVK